MTRIILSVSCLTLLFAANTSYGFGSKPMQVSELKGVTEAQVSVADGKANVLVRGKSAELLFKVIKQKQEEQTDTDALKWVGSADSTETTVRGKQITCSKVTKKDAADYACAFVVDSTGTLSSADETYNVSAFNLARTETGSKVFKKKKDRSIASVAPTASFDKGAGYVLYDKPGNQRNAEQSMIVFRGDTAKDILGLLESNDKDTKESTWGAVKGRKGQDIACVGATDKEPARCAVVVSFEDGSVTSKGNPLFQ